MKKFFFFALPVLLFLFSLPENKSVPSSSYFILQLSIIQYHSLQSNIICITLQPSSFTASEPNPVLIISPFFLFQSHWQNLLIIHAAVKLWERDFFFLLTHQHQSTLPLHIPVFSDPHSFCSLPTVALATETSWKCMLEW